MEYFLVFIIFSVAIMSVIFIPKQTFTDATYITIARLRAGQNIDVQCKLKEIEMDINYGLMYLCTIELTYGIITKRASSYIDARNYVSIISFDNDIINYYIERC